MAQTQELVSCPSSTWTQLTNSDVTNITIIAHGDMYLRITAGTTPPADSIRTGFPYLSGKGSANITLSDLTSLSGANRVWGRGQKGNVGVTVDHA